MSNSVEIPLFASLSEPSVPGTDAVIDEYLERLVAPLVGTVPYAERARLKGEAAFHLERLREDFLAMGFESEDASRKAVATYGVSRRMSDDFLESWFKKQARGPLSRRLGHANAVAIGAFGLAQLVCVVVFQMRVYLPSESVFRYAIRPSLVHEFVPISVPIPELTPLYLLMLLAVVLAPALAGWFVGSRVPIHAARAAYSGMLPCILYSLVMGTMMLPMKELLLFAVWQVFFWLPVGAGVATVASSFCRFRRCVAGGES